METPTIVKQTKDYIIVKVFFPKRHTAPLSVAIRNNVKNGSGVRTKRNRPSK